MNFIYSNRYSYFSAHFVQIVNCLSISTYFTTSSFGNVLSFFFKESQFLTNLNLLSFKMSEQVKLVRDVTMKQMKVLDNMFTASWLGLRALTHE